MNNTRESIDDLDNVSPSKQAKSTSFQTAFSNLKKSEFYKDFSVPKSETSVATVLNKANTVFVSPKQKGNPLLKYITNVPWEYSDIVPDYVMGKTTCSLFLSIRYHQLNPDYIHERLKLLGNAYNLRVLLVQVDVADPHHVLKHLTRISILADMTLMLAWNAEDAGKIIEMYKIYENKPPDDIMERSDTAPHQKFQRNFRLQRSTYAKLKNLYEESQFFHNAADNIISSDQKLLAFLWFAGNKVSIRDVAGRFNMAESTFHNNSDNIMDFLNDIAKSIIKFPQTLEEKIKISRKFESINGFPGILGCIDGTYISIRTPAHKIKSTYVNRHDMPSLTLQAICDADKMFLDVFTGPPSKVHDARIFKLSFISTILPETCGDEWHILGDAAYPLKKYLITPYRDYGTLTEQQRNFNYKFSVCRVKIENAFGLLKTRFRQLIRLDFNTVQRSCKFILACCTLHNLCIHYKDNLDDFMEEVDIVNIQDFEEINRDDNRIEGEKKRNRLCQLLS